MKVKARCMDKIHFDVEVDTDDLEEGETLEELVGRTIREKSMNARLVLYEILEYQEKS